MQEQQTDQSSTSTTPSWNWNHNGLGGAVAWDFQHVGLSPLKSPSNPKLVLKRQRRLKEATTQSSNRRKLSILGWQIVTDPQTGYEYYHHQHTGESQWDMPDPHSKPISPTHKIELAMYNDSNRPSTTPETNNGISISSLSRPSSPNHPPPRQRKRLLSARMSDYTPGEWRQLQQIEANILEQEAHVKRQQIELEKNKQKLIHQRKSYCIDLVSSMMTETFQIIQEHGCLKVTFVEAGSIGIQFIPRKGGRGCMVDKIVKHSRAETKGIRRGNFLIRLNDKDVTHIPTAKMLINIIKRSGFPLHMTFRPAPNRTNTALKLHFTICKIQNAYRKRVAWRKRFGSVLIEAIARGYLGRKIGKVQKIEKIEK